MYSKMDVFATVILKALQYSTLSEHRLHGRISPFVSWNKIHYKGLCYYHEENTKKPLENVHRLPKWVIYHYEEKNNTKPENIPRKAHQ